MKQAVCKTVALGPCWFKSNSADYTPQSLNRVEALFGRQLVGDTGLRVQIPPVAFHTGMCANRAGGLSRKQVIRKGLGVRIPPSSLLITSKPLWQNWQMHLPAKQGSDRPASGVGTREWRYQNIGRYAATSVPVVIFLL